MQEKENLELFLLKLRYQEGSLIEVEANKPFLLSDPDSAWVVYSGTIDVFAVSVQEGEVIGARSHLFRGGAGQLLLGIELEQRASGIGLLVSGLPGTRVLKLRRSRLQALAADLEFRELVAAMLEDWAAGLSNGICPEVLPKDYILLQADQEVVLEQDQVAVPKKGILWVRPLEGNSHFMGYFELGWVDTASYLPVSSRTWLSPIGSTKLRAVDTEAFINEDTEWSALELFHTLVLDAIVLNRNRLTSTEQERLQKKSEADALVMDDALTRLASPLTPEAVAELADLREDGRQPMLVACRLVGQKLGLEMQTYPGMGKDHLPRAMLMNLAKASRFRIRQVALRGEWWRTDSGPLLGFWEEDEQPVALLPTSPRSYELVDPVRRDRTPVTPEVDSRLSPFAYTFYRPFPNRMLTARDVLRFGLQGNEDDLLKVVLMGAAAGLLSLLPPVATKLIFNTIIPAAERGLLFQIGLALFLVALATGIFQIIRSLAMLRVQSRMDATIQAAIWDRILSLPVPFFRNYTSGDLGVRAMGITEIRRLLSGHIMTTILSSLFSVFNLVLLFIYSSSLALVALILVLIVVIATLLTGKLQIRYQRTLSEVQGQVSGKVLQFLTGVSKFRVAGAERRAFALWSDVFTSQRRLAFKARRVGNNLLVFNAGYPVFASLAIFAVVSSSAQAELPTGDFLAFNLAFTQFLVAVLSLGSIMVTLFGIVPIFERARPILEALPEVDELKTDPGDLIGEIEVNHVSFRYREDGPLILEDVSIRIQAGEFVAFVGPSGSGKSTLLRLLMGFETPESGGIFYDGQDLCGLDLRAVRQQIGVVLQSAKIMSGDIFTNIVGASPYMTVDDAWEAARMTGLDDDIKLMPMGMNTVVSEYGSNLSGGQRQRLLIARAIINKPRILFFDEATSALDNRTQDIVSRSLESLQTTRVVIAHRLSTIMAADRIYVFESGRIVQTGTYKELINR
ncbi:MAG: NHLP bacteriocin export ABC transporter permease/ATPase subunit, partial [Anaerolineales bacterium]|nr:NHLP bacteriocin export ABC transporter permease/ATPase subunit [Anaerolineales bacterium]